MCLITKTLTVKWQKNNKVHYESKGYIFTDFKNQIKIKTEDLSDGSGEIVEVECTHCGKKSNKRWVDYLACVNNNNNNNNNYYCRSCATIMYGNDKRKSTNLKNGKTFEKWCIENDRQDILDRWDYDLNNCNPSEISFSSHEKIWFTCPRKIHLSESMSLNGLTNQKCSLKCKTCNSFSQWGTDSFGGNFLEKYWDYEKNDKVGNNPWEISHSSQKKVWIKCQEKHYHDSYDTTCANFSKSNNRCPYCSGRKVHIDKSLGVYIADAFGEDFIHSVWSDKNTSNSFEYRPKSDKVVWWKCSEGKHNDFERSVINSHKSDFRCPECRVFKGENAISEYLIKHNIYYTPQQKYSELVGVGGGLLSYDFYLSDYSILIEYQGEFHDGSVSNQTEKEFANQQEHDRRKKEYTKLHNINLLEIWYYDFDRVEEILSNELNINAEEVVISE